MTTEDFPIPVKRDKYGKLFAEYSVRDWFAKIAEETFEAHEATRSDQLNYALGLELADIITVCVSYLDVLGFDEKKRTQLFRVVNAKNNLRGYFEEL